jgi:hypothetical protein
VDLRFVAGRLSLFIGERIALLGSATRSASPEWKKRLEDSGARVYRTDVNGAATFYLDGHSVTPWLAALH